jgi:hypothetical protein
MTTPAEALIRNLHKLGLKPFVYSTVYAAPGAIISAHPSYIVEDNIFEDHYKFQNANPFNGLKGTPDAKPHRYEALIADVFHNSAFLSKNDLSVAFDDKRLGAALEIGTRNQALMRVKPVQLQEYRYTGLAPNSLAEAFTQVKTAPPETALGQLVRTMKRHPVFDLLKGSRDVEIAQFVVAAKKLEIEFVYGNYFAMSLKTDLENFIQNGAPLNVAATVGGQVQSKTTVVWDAGDKALPMLWHPWNYAWDPGANMFVTLES